jgi:hypothetical protein
MFVQLNPQIPLRVIDKGNGMAIGVIDYSQDHDLLWVIVLDNGEIWVERNANVRGAKNLTMGRTNG